MEFEFKKKNLPKIRFAGFRITETNYSMIEQIAKRESVSMSEVYSTLMDSALKEYLKNNQ